MANVVINAPSCIGPTYSVTVVWDAGTGIVGFLLRLFRWFIRLLGLIFRIRKFAAAAASYSVTCSGPGSVSNTQPPPPYPGPSGTVTFTFTGATSGGDINATLNKEGGVFVANAIPVTVGWCPYSSMAIGMSPAARLADCRELHVTVPDGDHAGVHRATAVGHLAWRAQLGKLTCEVAADCSAAGLVLRVGHTSAAPDDMAFEPFSATFPGTPLGARGRVLVSEA